MSMNFDGLGIGFTGEDDGAEKTVEGLRRSADDLWDSIQKIGSTVPKFGKNVIGGLKGIGNTTSRTLGIVATGIGNLVDRAMSPEIDSAYASMYASFNKEFSSMTAGMKDTTGRLDQYRKKVGGIAQGMGEDMNAAAGGLVAFEKQGINLEKVLGTNGIDSTIKRLIKTTSVFNIKGEDLAATVGGLKHSFGMSEDQIGSLMDKMFYVGKNFNMGSEAIQGMSSVLESANKDLAVFGKQATPKNVTDYMVQMTKLGGVMHDALGIDGAKAMDMARESMTVFMQERDNLRKMSIGMGDEFGPMLKGLLEAGNNSDEVFQKLIQGNPIKFFEMMNKVADQAKGATGDTGIRFQRLKQSMFDTFGPDMTYLATANLDNVKQKLGEVDKGLEKSRGELGKTADQHWKTSVTAGEAWDMMVNNMKAKVFGLSNKEIFKWQKTMKAGFNESFDIVSAMAKDDGPLGELTTRLLAVQRVGLSALLPGLGAMGPMLQGVATDALPALTAMGAMGVRFSDLGKLAGVGGGAYLFFKLMTDGPDKVIKNITDMTDSLLGIAETKIFKDTKNLGIQKWIKGFRSEIKKLGLFDAIVFEFKSIEWGNLFDKAMIKADDVSESVMDFVDKIPWENMASGAVSGIGSILKGVGGAVWSFVFGDNKAEADEAEGRLEKLITRVFTGAFGAAKKAVKGAAHGLWDSVFDTSSAKESIDNLLKIATGAFAALMVISKKFRGTMFKGAADMIFGKGKPRTGSGDAYGSGIANLIPGLNSDVGSKEKVKPPPVPSLADQMRRRMDGGKYDQVAGGGLSGGLYLGKGMEAPKMVHTPMGFVPEGGIFAKPEKPTVATRVSRVAKSTGNAVMSGVKKAGGVAWDTGKKAAGAAKSIASQFVGPMMAIAGVAEGLNQIAERRVKLKEIDSSSFLSSMEKDLLKADATFDAFSNTVNSTFFGLPALIGGAFDVSLDDAKLFYDKLIAYTEFGIEAAVENFTWLKDTAVGIFDSMTAKSNRMAAEVAHSIETSFIGMKQTFYDVSDTAQDVLTGLSRVVMRPFKLLSHEMMGWYGDLIGKIFGKEGEWGGVQDVLSKVISENAVKGFQKVGGTVRKQYDIEQAGFKTYGEALDAQTKKEDDKREKDRRARDQGLMRDLEMSNEALRNVYSSTESDYQKGTSDYILKSRSDLDRKLFADQASRISEAEKKSKDTRAAKERMVTKGAEQDLARIQIEDEIATLGIDREKLKRKMGNRVSEKAAMKMEAEIKKAEEDIRSKGEKSGMSKEDILKYVDAAIRAGSLRPIEIKSSLYMDGKKMAESVDNIKAERAAATGL